MLSQDNVPSIKPCFEFKQQINKPTKYRKILTELSALTPMCNFELPEFLCTEKNLFIRERHNYLCNKITNLVNMVCDTV